MRPLVKPAIELAESLLKRSGAPNAAAKMSDEVFELPGAKLGSKSGNLGQDIQSTIRTSDMEGRISDLAITAKQARDTKRLKIQEGDEVTLVRNGAEEPVSVFKFDPVSELAIVKPRQVGKLEDSSKVQVDTSSLIPVNNRIFADAEGRVFSSKNPLDIEDLADVDELIFNPSLRAVHGRSLKPATLPKEISVLTEAQVSQNGKLIRGNVDDPLNLLRSIDEAPQIQFGSPTLFTQRTISTFNPMGRNANCMSCTASLVRTMKDRTLVTAEDIGSMTYRNTDIKLGNPTIGRFANDDEAIEWFGKAADTRLSRVGINPLPTPDTSYAVTISPSIRQGSQTRHMVFGHRFSDGRMLFYDAQKGVRYPESSLGSNGSSISFYALK